MNQNVQQLHELLKRSSHIVFFGGAGVSTASNIPDFRSDEGLYSGKEQKKYPYPPETMLSHTFFVRHTEEVGKLSAVITQNIDGLHQQAGSKRVYELHGSVHRNTCQQCGKHYSLQEMLQWKGKGVPRCSCGGVIKPDVVLYEESLDSDVLEKAIRHIMAADLMIVGGTSLAVYPAAGLLQYYDGLDLVLINKTETPYDRRASLIIREPIGQVMSEAVRGL